MREVLAALVEHANWFVEDCRAKDLAGKRRCSAKGQMLR
jgi:hypothetical protein